MEFNFIFGIGQPTASPAAQPTVKTSNTSGGETAGTISEDDNTDNDGGEKGNVRPPRK